jgi:DNA repair protein RecN (Recombination protein N)
MLKELFLKNFAIAKNCQLTLSEGLNVLTGETGSGKTLLIQALSLLLGQKADLSYIRDGEEKAIIQARFEIDDNPNLEKILQEGGIEYEGVEDLIITRELYTNQKNKVFIQSQLASLPLLKKLSELLLETVSQHSQITIKEKEVQRDFLDRFCNHEHLAQEFKSIFVEHQNLLEEISDLKQKLIEGRLQVGFWIQASSEICLLDLKENEEACLFEELKKQENKEKILSTMQEAQAQISDQPASLLSQLTKIKKLLIKLTDFDSSLEKYQAFLNQSFDLAKELSYELSTQIDSISSSYDDVDRIEKRLSEIKKIQKKYGSSFLELESFKKKAKEKIEEFNSLQELIEEKEKRQCTLHNVLKEKAQVISIARKNGAKIFSEKVLHHLFELNLEKSLFEIDVRSKELSQDGIDNISFLFSSSSEGSLYELNKYASGGEIARIYLALILVLNSEKIGKTLVFDELDANIGGVTASFFGAKLKLLGKNRQIICITHFPQVASYASSHLLISKEIIGSGALTSIKTLNPNERKLELLRMVGGEQFLSQSSIFN